MYKECLNLTKNLKHQLKQVDFEKKIKINFLPNIFFYISKILKWCISIINYPSFNKVFLIKFLLGFRNNTVLLYPSALLIWLIRAAYKVLFLTNTPLPLIFYFFLLTLAPSGDSNPAGP